MEKEQERVGGMNEVEEGGCEGAVRCCLVK